PFRPGERRGRKRAQRVPVVVLEVACVQVAVPAGAALADLGVRQPMRVSMQRLLPPWRPLSIKRREPYTQAAGRPRRDLAMTVQVGARRTLIAALAAMLAASAAAHQGWEWTEDEEFELTGTIEEIYLGNPHAHLKVQAEDGLWDVDLAPPGPTQRAG